MKIRLTQIDGKFPNLALMKLAHFYRSQGHQVKWTRKVERELDDKDMDLVLGSQIFCFSEPRAKRFKSQFPNAIIKGTGTDDLETVEHFLGIDEYEHYDYSDYPEFESSIGFTQRGCRLKCSFCVVPKKEGKVKGVSTIADIWRGGKHVKQLHLLDNDFFGQEQWRERAEEIIEGKFKVCLNQGINVRLIHEEGAKYLARMNYRDDQFKTKRIYTAWDNRRDEKVFFNGVDMLLKAGIKPDHIFVYMLCGYWPNEDFQNDVYYRWQKMKDAGLLPYPMIYNNENKDLKKFQRWVVRRYWQISEWEVFKQENASDYHRRVHGNEDDQLQAELNYA